MDEKGKDHGKKAPFIFPSTSRIETLTDGIFAIAMTLLILTLDLPQVKGAVNHAVLHEFLFGQADKFFNYALSFIILAVFWIIHHQQFHYIKRTDRTHLWINIFILMFIALIPFSTSLVGIYINDWLDNVFFAANMIILGSLFFLNWQYAANGHKLVDCELDQQVIDMGRRRCMVTPAVSFVALIVAFVCAPLSGLVYLLMPLILSLPGFQH